MVFFPEAGVPTARCNCQLAQWPDLEDKRIVIAVIVVVSFTHINLHPVILYELF